MNTSGEIHRSSTDRTDGLNSRNRNSSEINQIFKATGGPASFIDDLLLNNDSLDILEVGFGWGINLLELAWMYKDCDINFSGVDIETKPELLSSEGIIDFAKKHKIFPEQSNPRFKIPKFYFYDANYLQFADESMDFIYSAVTIRFMRDKIAFIEEAARVLRPGGIALLHIGESNWNYPHCMTLDDQRLTTYTSRLVLTHKNELIPLPEYFKLFERNNFKFRFTTASRCILILTKVQSGKLNLELKLNENLTLPGRKVPLINKKNEIRGGAAVCMKSTRTFIII